jgi:hypothetical protein
LRKKKIHHQLVCVLMDKEKRRSCSYLKEDFEEYDKG